MCFRQTGERLEDHFEFNQRVIAKDKAVSLFGASVSMSGKTAVIGAPYTSLGTNPNHGAAYVFGQR